MTGDVCCGSGRADAVAVACPWFWRCAMNASRLAGAGWTLGEGCVADDGCFFSASARAVGGAAMEAVGEAAGLSGRSGAVCVGAGCDAGDSNVAETGAEPVWTLLAAGIVGMDAAGANAARSACGVALPEPCPLMTIGTLAGDRAGGGTSSNQGNVAIIAITRMVAPIRR